jgi:hypothetical protein
MEDATVRWIRATARNLIGGEAFGSELRILSLELEALDPYWYGTFGTLILDTGLFLDDAWLVNSSREVVIVPPADPYDFTLEVPGTTVVRKIRARFEAPSINPVGLLNVTPLVPVGFRASILPSGASPLVVDNEQRTVLQGATSFRKDLVLEEGNVHGEYICLFPGTNRLRLIGKPARLRLTFYPSYL